MVPHDPDELSFIEWGALMFDAGFRVGREVGLDAGYAAAEDDMAAQWAAEVDRFHRDQRLDRSPDERVALADAFVRTRAERHWLDWHRRHRPTAAVNRRARPDRRVS
jgi:hypothetical protein